MRPRSPEIDTAGSDSFLDVITNIVGIMIILVMIVSDRAKRAPVTPDNLPSSAEQQKLQAARSNKASIVSDIDRLVGRMRELKLESLTRFRERAELATIVTAVEHELESKRQQIGEQQRQQFDAQRELALAKAELSRLERQDLVLPEPVEENLKIESFPTPLSKTVDGKEVHVQLKGGRVAIIPIDDLVTKLQFIAKQRVQKLRDQPEFTETIGPMGGFRLRYTIERKDIPLETVVQTGRAGSIVELAKFEILPTSSELGEPLEIAMSERSTFRAQLEAFKPGQYTVTLWTYDDSFEAFRAIRKELYHKGYAVAARPLPKDTPIGGSPHGSKSAAQ